MDDKKDQPAPSEPTPAETTEVKPEEFGGAKRTTEPTRYQDWEINGKCVDF